MTDSGRKRPLLAVVLAFVFPGLGHFYLRKWGRGLVWIGLTLAVSTLLVVTGTVEMVDEFTTEAVLAAYRARPQEATIASVVISTLNVADAYWVAIRENRSQEIESGRKCPNCGRELDQDIDFCHWCTTRLEPVDADGQ